MKSTTSKLCTTNNNKCAILTTSKGRTLALRKKWTVTVERKRDKVSWNKEFPSSKEKWNRDRSDRQKWEGRELKVLSKVLNDLKTICQWEGGGMVRSLFFFKEEDTVGNMVCRISDATFDLLLFPRLKN